jgi:hypothetical protein
MMPIKERQINTVMGAKTLFTVDKNTTCWESVKKERLAFTYF